MLLFYRIKLLILAAVFAFLSSTSLASASLNLTFTETALSTGILNGISFTNATITLSTTIDTSTVYNTGNTYFAPAGSVTRYSIAGIGSGSFTDAVSVFDLQGNSTQYTAAGFADLTVSHDIIDTASAVFGTYALQSILPPTSGTVAFSAVATYGTSGGPLNLSSVTNPTFSASAVPEPVAMGLIGLSALGVWRARRDLRTQ